MGNLPNFSEKETLRAQGLTDGQLAEKLRLSVINPRAFGIITKKALITEAAWRIKPPERD